MSAQRVVHEGGGNYTPWRQFLRSLPVHLGEFFFSNFAFERSAPKTNGKTGIAHRLLLVMRGGVYPRRGLVKVSRAADD